MISGRVLSSLALSLIAIVFAACGGGATSGGSDLTGEIEISGSSTVEPITALVAEKFRSANPGVSISVAGPGTSDGLALFCRGEIPIVNASRPIAEEEISSCRDNGVRPLELEVAIDGITVLTSPDNGEVDCLGSPDLYALLGPESEGFETWSDAEDLAQEVGAQHLPYPDEELVVTGPGEESGTWGSFVEIVLADIADERGAAEVTRPDYQSSANDNVIIEGIQTSPYSLGWVGFAYYEQSADVVRAIPVGGGDGACVAPTRETIADGSYPLARDLYLYVDPEQAPAGSAVESFIDFFLSDEGLASVSEAGYVPQPEDEIAATTTTWSQRDSGGST